MALPVTAKNSSKGAFGDCNLLKRKGNFRRLRKFLLEKIGFWDKTVISFFVLVCACSSMVEQ
jgi:hypothetical protein